MEKRIKEKRNELTLIVFKKIDFDRLERPTGYSKEMFDDYLLWKISKNLSARYDIQLKYLFLTKNQETHDRMLKNIEYDFKQEQLEILTNIYFEFGKNK